LRGRGLFPRLSMGTLQLSMRCSSIHFLPMRSFPVSDDPLAGATVAALIHVITNGVFVRALDRNQIAVPAL